MHRVALRPKSNQTIQSNSKAINRCPRTSPWTLACGDYEIIRPLKEGRVQPDGIDLTILTAMDSTTRHWRFLRGQEFDMAEVSCSSFIVARDQGFPASAIPVFLHRRFRHGFVFINTTKGIRNPTDLIGRRIGVKQFQATAIVWMRGILEHEYGVPQKSIEWFPSSTRPWNSLRLPA